MNIEFSPEQEQLRAGVRALLAECASPSDLRRWWTEATGRSPHLWARLSEMGIPGILVAKEFGGLGGDELDLAVVLEEVGRAALPDAVLEACLIAPHLIASSASPALRERWLPAIASGAARIAVSFGGSGIAADAHISDAVLIERGTDILLVEAEDVVAEPLVSMDPSRRLFRVRPRSGAGVPLTDPDRSGAVTRILTGTATLLNGVASRLVELACDYAKLRTQFGRPIGSFQAIKHQLAQATSLNSLSRYATIAATYAVARGQADRHDAAALAYVCAVDAEAESNRVALQVHGGVGFTWESDLQIWLKHGKVLELGSSTRRDAALAAGSAAFRPLGSRAV